MGRGSPAASRARRPWRVGALAFERPVFLAPMEGHSDAAFRRVCRHLGADLAFTEFVPWQVVGTRSGRRKLRLWADERPVGIQLYGRDPERMARAAREACRARPEVLDLNFGCPAKGADGGGCGSQLLREPELLLDVARAVVEAADRPVTAKLRLGWDDATVNVVDVAGRLVEEGVAALTVHGRTRCQRYEGEADWGWIGRVVEAVDVPVVGNGDLRRAEEVLRRFEETGVAGVMIGRAALDDPWIFARVRAALDGLPGPPAPAWGERFALCRLHLERSLEDWGQPHGLRRMRGRYAIYLAGHPDFEGARRRLVRQEDPAAVLRILRELEARASCAAPSTARAGAATNGRARDRSRPRTPPTPERSDRRPTRARAAELPRGRAT